VEEQTQTSGCRVSNFPNARRTQFSLHDGRDQSPHQFGRNNVCLLHNFRGHVLLM